MKQKKSHARYRVRGAENAQLAESTRSPRALKQAAPRPSLQMFNYYLVSNHLAVRVVIDNIAGSYGLFWGPKKRRATPRNQEILKTIVSTLIANLAKAVMLAGPNGVATLGVSLRKTHLKLTRYDRKEFNRLPAVLEELLGAGLFSLHPSSHRGRASTLIVSKRFHEEMSRFRLRPEHFEEDDGERETIVLSQTKRDHYDNTHIRKLIPYDDTPETLRYRAEMATINEALRKADMRITGELIDKEGRPVFTGARRLYRRFNSPNEEVRFDLGGRLFGGWWEQLKREDRHAIRLNGEPIVELDFSSMFLRLAYLEAGLQPPPCDLYAGMPGRLSEGQWRPGIKTACLTLLFIERPLVRLPRDVKVLLPPKITAREVRSAILSCHPQLEAIFESGAGLRFMFTESQILVATLLRLIRQGVVALPLHDGLLAAASGADLAEKAMGDTAEEIAGFRLPIASKCPE